MNWKRFHRLKCKELDKMKKVVLVIGFFFTFINLYILFSFTLINHCVIFWPSFLHSKNWGKCVILSIPFRRRSASWFHWWKWSKTGGRTNENWWWQRREFWECCMFSFYSLTEYKQGISGLGIENFRYQLFDFLVYFKLAVHISLCYLKSFLAFGMSN